MRTTIPETPDNQATIRLRAALDGLFAELGIEQVVGPPLAYFTVDGARYEYQLYQVKRSLLFGHDDIVAETLLDMRGRLTASLPLIWRETPELYNDPADQNNWWARCRFIQVPGDKEAARAKAQAAVCAVSRDCDFDVMAKILLGLEPRLAVAAV